MADRYWVGGDGPWNSSSTANWSATSGGASGASAPTSADDVFFNSSSNATAYAVTVGLSARARDITIAGPASGNVTITSAATSVLECYGSWTNAATGVVFSTTTGAAINFLSTTTGRTITTNNVTWAANATTFAGVGGGWSLGSAFTNTAGLAVTNGAFSTSASNYALNTGALSTSGTATRSISLNASAVTVTASTCINIANPTGLTFNAGTSTITCSATSPLINGNGQTFNNVTFSGTNGGTTTIQGVNTFNNLTQTSVTATGIRRVIFSSSQTITGTLTLGAANTPIRRVHVFSVTPTGLGIGTPVTLTVATIATLADVDFRDITAAGASGTWSGTRLGNAGGNSNITFAAGVNKYWNLASSGNWTQTTAWALTSGGATSTNNFPLAQDTAIIEDTGLTAGNTITFNDNWFIGTIDASTRTTAFTLASGTVTPFVVGSYTVPSVATITGTGTWYFQGYGATQTITTNGDVLTFPINCNGSTTNIVRLSGNLTTTNLVTLQQGTLDLNNNVLSANQFNGSSTGVRTLAFGTGKMVLAGSSSTVFNTDNGTNLTITGSKRVEYSYSGSVGLRQISGPGTATTVEGVNICDHYILAGTDGFNPNGARSYGTVDFAGFGGTVSGGSPSFYGSLVLSSVSTFSTSGLSISFLGASGTKTITSNGKTIDGNVAFNGVGSTFTLQDALTIPSTATLTLTNGTLNLAGYTLTAGIFSSSNSNVRTLAFGTTGKIDLTGTTATVFSTSIATNLTVTGTNPLIRLTADVPFGTSRGTVFGAAGESNAISVDVTAGADTINLSTTQGAYRNVNFTGFTGTVFFSNSIFIFGNWNFGGATATGGSGTATFAATSGTKTITSNGGSFPGGVTFNGVGGAWTLQDNLTMSAALGLTTGTLNLGSYTLTCNNVGTSNSNTRAINFGTGKIVLTGRDQTVWTSGTATGLTVTGTRTVELTGVGVSGETRTITGPNVDPSAANIVDFYIKSGADIVSLGTANRFYRTLDFTGFSGSTLGDISPQIYGDLVLSTGMTVTGGSNGWTFVATTSQTITSNGVTINNTITFDGIGGTWTCTDALTLGSTRALTLTNGTLKLKNGTTNTVGSIATSGTNQKFLQSTVNGSRATLSAASGVSDVSYVTLKDSAATGGARFQAFTSNGNVNAGNNLGWFFINAVGFLSFF
jgi:hypothetical protein